VSGAWYAQNYGRSDSHGPPCQPQAAEENQKKTQASFLDRNLSGKELWFLLYSVFFFLLDHFWIFLSQNGSTNIK